MLPDDVRPISVDDHIIEPAHLWAERLPERHRAAGPRIVELPDGTEAWALEDTLVQTVRGNTRTLPGYDDDPESIARFSEMRPGCYDPVARLADMDLDGVWAQLNFPDFSRFAGHRFLTCTDKDLAHSCVRAYNDFVVEEWTATDRERLWPLAIVPLWDPFAAAAEVERVAGMGVRAIAFSENPTSLGLPSIHTPHWDPLWRAADDAAMVVCLHIGSSSKLIRSSDDAPPCSAVAYVGANSMVACTDWLFSGTLERFPNLRVAFSEGGAGWVPYLLEQAEILFHHYPHQIPAQRGPRETFAEHMYVCVLQDAVALTQLDVIGADNVLWESDYPHDSTTFPESARRLRAALEHVPDDIARKIAEDNARALFR